MKHTKLKIDKFENLDDYLAAVDKETRKSEDSILIASGLLPMPEDEDEAKEMAYDIISGKSKSHAFIRTLQKLRAADVTVEIMGQFAQSEERTSAKKKLKYSDYGLWVKHPQLGIQTPLWFKNFIVDGVPQFDVSVGKSLTLPLTIVDAKVKVCNLTNKNKLKFVQYNCASLVQCKGALQVRNATNVDITSQATAFAAASSKAVYENKFMLNFKL
tara:strand:+ start:105 stop:749 length:645 start_codon:yes stop_codon:yes gene_type:complete